jgi:hypothetical protein
MCYFPLEGNWYPTSKDFIWWTQHIFKCLALTDTEITQQLTGETHFLLSWCFYSLREIRKKGRKKSNPQHNNSKEWCGMWIKQRIEGVRWCRHLGRHLTGGDQNSVEDKTAKVTFEGWAISGHHRNEHLSVWGRRPWRVGRKLMFMERDLLLPPVLCTMSMNQRNGPEVTVLPCGLWLPVSSKGMCAIKKHRWVKTLDYIYFLFIYDMSLLFMLHSKS